jgi:3'(2'), 5'-bisphosphate nucleotidase
MTRQNSQVLRYVLGAFAWKRARMDLLDQVASIARRAGANIMEIYAREDHGTTLKDDASPLTLADEASHNTIVEGLAKLEPRLPILSEEAEAASPVVRAGWSRFWLVDPLDGTKEFIKRNGEFTVNNALIGRPVLGVVYAPVLDLMYQAAEGHGAFKGIGGDKPEPIAVSDYRSVGLRVVASRSHAGELMPRFLALAGDPECVSKGSSLKLCLVADGTANLYPRFGPTMEWDVAAAHAIVAEAGGQVVDPAGAPLRYNKDDLHNPWFIVEGNPPFPWQSALAGAQNEQQPA